jgi:hypothetical protein
MQAMCQQARDLAAGHPQACDASRVTTESFSSDAVLQVLMDESRALRAEHDQRIAKQQDVTQLALAAVAALIALAAALAKSGHASGVLQSARPLLPVVSIILSGLFLMALEHDMNIVHIQRYLQDDLGPRISEALGKDKYGNQVEIWGWVAYRAAAQQHSGHWRLGTIGMSISKYVAAALPNIGVLILYVASSGSMGRLAWLSKTAYGVALLLFSGALLAGAYVSRTYLELRTDRPPRARP